MNAQNRYEKEYFPKQVRFDTPSKSDPRLQSYSDPRLPTHTDSRHHIQTYGYSRHQMYGSDSRQHSESSQVRQQSVPQTRRNSDTDSPCPRPAAYQQLRLSTDKLAYNYGNEIILRKNATLESTPPNVFNNYYASNQNFTEPTKLPNMSFVSDDITCNLDYKTQTQTLKNNYASKPLADSSTSNSKQQILMKKDLHHPAPSNELDLSIFDCDNGFRSKMLNNVSKTQTMASNNVEPTNTSKYTCEYNEMPHPFPPNKNLSQLGSLNVNGNDELLVNKSATYPIQGNLDTPDKTADFFLKPGQDIKNPLTLPNIRKDNELVLKSKLELTKVPTVLKDHTNLIPAPNFHTKQSYPCNFTNMQFPYRNSTKENIYPAHNNCNCMSNIPNCQVYRSTAVQNQPYHLCCNYRDRHECNIPNTPTCSSKKIGRSNTIALKSKAIEERERQQKENTLDDRNKELSLKKPDKEEPTVSDLCQIIKLQNEQLQLLQERVDKLVTLNENKMKPTTCDTICTPIEHTVNQEVMTVETINDNIQKISIGVMTSFEMVRTSHSIIKGHNIQHIQCSQSQISVTKVGEPANFLDGITRCNKNTDLVDDKESQSKGKESAYDKTLNDLSLYPPQIEEVRSPDVSPETSLHLDVQDYSDSDEGNSNVGWTYYNQVMNHVNEILGSSQDNNDTPQKSPGVPKPPFTAASPTFHAARPSSNAAKPPLSAAKSPFSAVKPAVASRLMGAANISVSTSKRVTFGDCQEAIPQDINHGVACTETSLQMNRLALKYLQRRPEPKTSRPQPVVATLNDMSLATRQYMQQHRLLQGVSPEAVSRFPNKILDITALKQQPKLL